MSSSLESVLSSDKRLKFRADLFIDNISIYPEANYSAIKTLVASGGQPPRSVKEESVVGVVLPHYRWVFVATWFARGSPAKLELTEQRGGDENKSKDFPEEGIQSHPGASFSGQLTIRSKRNPAFTPLRRPPIAWRGK